MKKKIRSVIAMFLVCTMLFSVNASAIGIKDKHNGEIRLATDIVGGIIDGAFALLDAAIPNVDCLTKDDYFAGESENFYEGTDTFIDAPAENASWSLGYGRESLVPDNLKD